MVIRAFAATLLGAVALVVAVALVGGADEGSLHDIPDRGTVEPIVGPEGAPAFLAHHTDGSVRAFLGIAPHSGLPLAWCSESQAFIEPVGASRFDAAGRYLGGPARGGLRPFEIEVVDGHAVIGELLEPPGRSPGGVVPVVPGDVCLATEGYVLGVHAPTSQLRGPLPPQQAARSPRWVRVEGVVERDDDRFLVCAAAAAPCSTGSVVARQVFDGAQPQPGERVVGEFVALADGGGFAALFAPFGLTRAQPLHDPAPQAENGEPWCGEAELVAVRGDFNADGGAAEVALSDVRPRSTVESGCDYGAPPPGGSLVREELALPSGGYATFVLDVLFSSSDDLSADGIVTSEELGAALDIAAPVTVIARQQGGRLIGFWVPRPR